MEIARQGAGGRSCASGQQGATCEARVADGVAAIEPGNCLAFSGRDLFGEPVRPPRGAGRSRHVPTDRSRATVALLRGAGFTQPKIAAEVGLSLPTLRLHYPSELESASQTGRRRAMLDQAKENDQ